jgi:hypothetical protein
MNHHPQFSDLGERRQLLLCPSCGEPLPAEPDVIRKIITPSGESPGVWEIRRCRNPACQRYHHRACQSTLYPKTDRAGRNEAQQRHEAEATNRAALDDGEPAGKLSYQPERHCFTLNGQALHVGDGLELAILGYWIPGRVEMNPNGWYLLTLDQVGIRLHAGLTARWSKG